MARRRYDRLMETVSGIVLGWPASDLPLEENSPAPRVQAPVEVTRTRRIAAGAAVRSHVMANANATLPVSASDTIWLWLRVHDASQLTGISLRLGTGTRQGAVAAFAKGVFWGAADGMPIAAETAELGKRHVGDLPESGIWHRLEIPASAVWDAAGGTLDGFPINAIEFTQRGGDVEWGSFGKDDGAGLFYTYIADDAPAGATLTDSAAAGAGWPWTVVAGREQLTVAEFGTIVTSDVCRAAALDSFRADWTRDFLKPDLDRVDENGIAAFLASVDTRLKATNDAIDLGFVRARADIYRVRQIMLGADAASRLVTSPALSDLAQRDEGARATSKGISDFLIQAVKRTPADTVIRIGAAAAPAAAPAPAPAASVGVFQPRLMTLNIASTASLFSPPLMTSARLATTTALTAPTPTVAAAIAAPATVFQAAVAKPAFSLDAMLRTIDASRHFVSDIQRQLPIAGLVERAVSVAERLTPQPAVQALGYALASKAAVVATLSGLSGETIGRPIGIALADIAMAGFRKKAGAPANLADIPVLSVLLADMRQAADQQQYEDADVLPAGDGQKHEADYFTAAVQAIDNSIAIMRLVEGRVALFEELAGALSDLKADIEASANEAAAYLRSVDVEVAEARHDLATAERLRQEEQERVAAVNERRAAILLTKVNAIAWRRTRAADLRDELPLIEAASGLAPNPVAVRRREHEDAPDEIHDYVQLLREVPVSWFPAIAAMVSRIERLESAHAAIRTMLERAAVPRMLAAPVEVTAASRSLRGAQNAMIAGRRVIEARRTAVTMLDATRVSLLSLSEAHVQLTTMATIGDLLAGTHRQPALTRAASEEIDAITTIAGCLHESFGEVAPIVRLGWAETLSEFDRPAPLANLAGLPGWGEVPVELRRTLQGFVDWLFSRVDQSQQPAMDAINELVRVCLLMAARARPLAAPPRAAAVARPRQPARRTRLGRAAARHPLCASRRRHSPATPGAGPRPGLDHGEALAVALLLAAECDASVARMIATLQAPIGGACPLAGLVATLVAAEGVTVASLWSGAASRSGLIAWGSETAPLPERTLSMPPWLVAGLCGFEAMPPGIGEPAQPRVFLPHSAEHAIAAEGEALRQAIAADIPALLVIRAHCSAEGEALAAARTAGLRLCHLAEAGAAGLATWLAMMGWLPMLHRNAGPGEAIDLTAFDRMASPLVVVAGPDGQVQSSRPCREWRSPMPDEAERAALWRGWGLDEPSAAAAAARYRQGAGRIAEIGRNLAGGGHGATLESLTRAMRESGGRIDAMARRTTARVRREDIVLTAELDGALDRLRDRILLRNRLSEEALATAAAGGVTATRALPALTPGYAEAVRALDKATPEEVAKAVRASDPWELGAVRPPKRGSFRIAPWRYALADMLERDPAPRFIVIDTRGRNLTDFQLRKIEEAIARLSPEDRARIIRLVDAP